MRFSVIIPAYNEEQYLPRLLKSIEVARANYSGGRDEIEVIVADNDSSDRTAEVAAHPVAHRFVFFTDDEDRRLVGAIRIRGECKNFGLAGRNAYPIGMASRRIQNIFSGCARRQHRAARRQHMPGMDVRRGRFRCGHGVRR